MACCNRSPCSWGCCARRTAPAALYWLRTPYWYGCIRPPDRSSPPRDCKAPAPAAGDRSEEHTSELQSQSNLVCRLLLEKKKKIKESKYKELLSIIDQTQ